MPDSSLPPPDPAVQLTFCDCGRPMPRGYCPDCADKARLERQREALRQMNIGGKQPWQRAGKGRG